jgi:IS4 transposase
LARHRQQQALGKHRWVVERTFAWINQVRRLTIRYERHAALSPFLVLAAALNIIAASVVMLLARMASRPWRSCSSWSRRY